MTKVYIWDKTGFLHIATSTIGDYGESRGVFNSDEWMASTEQAEVFFEMMTGEKPSRVEEDEE